MRKLAPLVVLVVLAFLWLESREKGTAPVAGLRADTAELEERGAMAFSSLPAPVEGTRVAAMEQEAWRLPPSFLETMKSRGIKVQLLDRDGAPAEGIVTFQHARDGGSIDGDPFDDGPTDRDTWGGKWGGVEFLPASGGLVMVPSDARVTAFGVVEGASGGTVRSDVIDLATWPTDETLVLRAQGPGVLRGRVVDAAGAPQVGVEVHAKQVLAGLPWWASRTTATGARYEGLGFDHLHVRTDIEGGFELAGLRAGEYHVWAELGGPPKSEVVLLGDGPVRADGVARDFVLERPHLRVFATEGGLPGPSIMWARSYAPETWPSGLAVSVKALAPGVAEPFAKGAVPGELLRDGSATFEAEADGRYEIVAYGMDWQPVRRVVELDGRRGRVDVELAMVRSPGRGVVVLDVVRPDGSGVDGRDLLVVTVRDRATGVELFEVVGVYWMRDEIEWPLALELPAGELRVEVAGLPELDSHGGVGGPRVHGEAAASIDVAPGSREVVRLELPAVARLQVALEGAPTLAMLEAARAESEASELAEEQVHARAAEVVIWATAPGRSARELLFEVREEQLTSNRGARIGLGTTGLEVAGLSPGTYTLHARTRDGRELEQTVTLVAGEAARVTFTF